MIDLEVYRPLFLEEARKRLDEVRRLLPMDDQTGMRMCFHTLRGMSGTMRYCSIASLAAALEEGCLSEKLVREALLVLDAQLREVEGGRELQAAPELERRLRGH